MQVKPTIYGKLTAFSTFSTMEMDKKVENTRIHIKRREIHLSRRYSCKRFFIFE